MRQSRERKLGQREGDEDGECKQELFPIESDDEHAGRVYEKSESEEPEARIDGENGIPEISLHTHSL